MLFQSLCWWYLVLPVFFITAFLSSISSAQTTEPPPPTGCSDSDIPELRPGSGGTDSYDIDLSGFRANGVNLGGADGALNSCAFGLYNDDHEIDSASSAGFESVIDPEDALTYWQQRYVSTSLNPGIHEEGVYAAYDSQHNQRYVLIQPGDRFFTPGVFVIRVKNKGTQTLENFNFNFRWYHYNDSEHPAALRVRYDLAEPTFNGEVIEEFSAPVAEGDPGLLVSECESVHFRNLSVDPEREVFVEFFINSPVNRSETTVSPTPLPSPMPAHYDEVGFGSMRITTDLEDESCQTLPKQVAPLRLQKGVPGFSDADYANLMEKVYENQINKLNEECCDDN